MTDIAVIILTKNEKLHIGRCLERLAPLEAKQVFVVDCFSDDGTQEIARSKGAMVVEPWTVVGGNPAKVLKKRILEG